MAIGKVLVLGATGPTGKLIVERAQELGWSITVYGRRTLPKHAQDPNIKTLEGQLDNEAQLRTAMTVQDVIISVSSPSGPLANMDVYVPATRLILKTMHSLGVKRIIALSTYSVIDALERPNLLRWLLVTGLWAMAHKGRDIDWTLFRVGFLANGPPMKPVDGYVGDGTVGKDVRRADIAEWMLKQAGKDTPAFVRERPGISSVKA